MIIDNIRELDRLYRIKNISVVVRHGKLAGLVKDDYRF